MAKKQRYAAWVKSPDREMPYILYFDHWGDIPDTFSIQIETLKDGIKHFHWIALGDLRR